MADLPKHKPNVVPGIEDWLRHHPELAENERLQARVEALERALELAISRLSHLANILTVQGWRDLSVTVRQEAEAARKLLEGR